tara:strand:+ start:103 stop:249 length:147 start_codon:yes stop_codon:yes gene_type:complete
MNNKTGNDRGILSNLNIMKNNDIINKVDTVMLLKMEIISFIDAYFHIP